jgi:2,4-dienoyl-CoA reductase-like NADH-dependent reductase (Old Yellow Enzyme family)
MWMREEIVPDLRRLTDAVHREGAAASIQLGHCGFFSNPQVIGQKAMGPSAKFCSYRLARSRAMTGAEIEEKTYAFVQAALLARQAGFDAIEIHAGHGYLLSQFLSPWTNSRQDQYGGSLENRLRFPAAVIRRVREGLGPDYPILVKMNQRDGFQGGLELAEAVEVARRFEAEGASALVPSCGFTARTALYMMRGNVPHAEMARNQKGVLMQWGVRLFGRFMVQTYPFEPMFLLEGARAIKDAVQIPVVYVGGVLSLENMEQAMEEGFGFVEIGRATIRDPDFVQNMEDGTIQASDCDQCNRCIAAMEAGGVICVTAEEEAQSASVRPKGGS